RLRARRRSALRLDGYPGISRLHGQAEGARGSDGDGSGGRRDRASRPRRCPASPHRQALARLTPARRHRPGPAGESSHPCTRSVPRGRRDGRRRGGSGRRRRRRRFRAPRHGTGAGRSGGALPRPHGRPPGGARVRHFGTLLLKEERAIFSSPIAYATVAVYLLLMGYTFTAILFLNRTGELVRVFFQAAVLFLLIVPV